MLSLAPHVTQCPTVHLQMCPRECHLATLLLRLSRDSLLPKEQVQILEPKMERPPIWSMPLFPKFIYFSFLSQMRKEIGYMSQKLLNTLPGLKQTLPFKHIVILVAKCMSKEKVRRV